MARSIEETRKAKREHMARKRAENPELARKKQRQWHKKNHERNKKTMRDYYAKRFFWGKAMKLRGDMRATYKELASLWRAQRGRCALTGRTLSRDAHLDHILPKARGGDDRLKNLRWLCPEVNMAKRNLTDDEFNQLCADVIGQRIEAVRVMLERCNAA